MKRVSGTFKAGHAVVVLDDGKEFDWTYHVGLLTGSSDIERAVLHALDDILSYASTKIPPPLPPDDTVGGPA